MNDTNNNNINMNSNDLLADEDDDEDSSEDDSDDDDTLHHLIFPVLGSIPSISESISLMLEEESYAVETNKKLEVLYLVKALTKIECLLLPTNG